MISYFGAKARMIDWIYPYIPKNNIKTYSEPFSGAFWIYSTPKADYSHVENIIYNDFNGHMANLFACLSNPETFLKHIEKEMNYGWLYTDKEGDDFKQFYKDIYYKYKHDKSEGNFLDNPTKNRPDFDAGVIYAFLLTSAFNGVFPRSGGFSGVTKGKIKLNALVNKLRKQEYIDKLKRITEVHNLDFEELIKKYDSEDTFFYLDPPYESDDDRRAGWYGVKDSFTHETHIRLLELIKNTKAKWALSYYYFEELEQLLPRDKYTWIEKDFFRSSASFSDSGAVAGTELLILNYDVSNIEIKELKKKIKPMARKNKLDVVNNVIEKIKIELEEDTLSNIRDLLNGLTVPKLDKYLNNKDSEV